LGPIPNPQSPYNQKYNLFSKTKKKFIKIYKKNYYIFFNKIKHG